MRVDGDLLSFGNRTLKTRPSNRIFDAIWTVGAAARPGTNYSPAHAIDRKLDVFIRQTELCAQLSNEQFVLPALLTC